MKNITKILALVLVLSMVCVVFASCGKTISGTYTLDATAEAFDLKTGAVTTYKFSGNMYTCPVETYLASKEPQTTETTEGTYEITEDDDGKLQISFTKKGSDDASTPVFFEQKDESITIGLLTFTKK